MFIWLIVFKTALYHVTAVCNVSTVVQFISLRTVSNQSETSCGGTHTPEFRNQYTDRPNTTIEGSVRIVPQSISYHLLMRWWNSRRAVGRRWARWRGSQPPEDAAAHTCQPTNDRTTTPADRPSDRNHQPKQR